MNPFIKPTVARPVSQNHQDHHWTEHSATSDLPPDSSPTATLPEAARGSVASTTGTDDPSQRSGIAGRPSTLATSVLAAFGLCFSLALSSVSGMASSPTIIVGATALVGVLVPRSAHAVDLNRATAPELQAVRGIGPKMARKIIDERTRGGEYASLSDLSDRVKGIGSKKVSALQAAGLTVAPASVAAKGHRPGATPVSAAPAKAVKR